MACTSGWCNAQSSLGGGASWHGQFDHCGSTDAPQKIKDRGCNSEGEPEKVSAQVCDQTGGPNNIPSSPDDPAAAHTRSQKIEPQGETEEETRQVELCARKASAEEKNVECHLETEGGESDVNSEII